MRAAAERETDVDRIWRLRMVIAITPITITAAAPIAIRADMLRIILRWPRGGGKDPGVESPVEFGFRTIGLGRTPGQDLFTGDPQRNGLPLTDEGDIVLKNPPRGSWPCNWLWEILKVWRWARLASCLGSVPARLLYERSTARRFISFDMDKGIGPSRWFCDRILHHSNPTKKSHENVGSEIFSIGKGGFKLFQQDEPS